MRIQGNEKRRGEDSSHPKGIGETANKGCPDPENFDNHMIAPQDYDVRQSGRALKPKKEIFGYDQQICHGIFLLL